MISLPLKRSLRWSHAIHYPGLRPVPSLEGCVRPTAHFRCIPICPIATRHGTSVALCPRHKLRDKGRKSGSWWSWRNPAPYTTPARQTVRSTPPPAWINPQLAKLVEKAPDGPEWLHEIKFDGYRMHARLDTGRVQILTRRGNDWTEKYPAIAKAISGLPAQNAKSADFLDFLRSGSKDVDDFMISQPKPRMRRAN
jgi:ATP dependent DNA ligase domain